jgi:hypothetical protein
MKMLTHKIWEEVIYTFFITPLDYLLAILGSIITIPLDILLSPLEIVAFIIYKIKERD